MKFVVQVGNLVWKDLTNEFRTKEMLSSMLIFSFLVIVIFAFAFNPAQATTREVFPGIIWVGFSFAGVLGLNRSFTTEKYNDCLMGLMLAPVDRTVIYFGKVITNFILMVIIEVISLPLFFVLFDYKPQGNPWLLIPIMFLGTLGFVAVGTFLAALSANTRASEILLPIILFPIIVPVIIAAVQSTAGALTGKEWSEIGRWIKLLAVYDIVFLAVPFILFDYVLEV
ncbi:heme exporter protein CcmB [Calderihabitans maritimus]|uniref:Heme exporter protein B n=1 Tax=Calderihabitans maritimus TaxID=1246530 RepID=A0A1Z5HWN1_9FIRM|nr:heme exporter protein CcmB [Calderihabitans maritimus]GAW93741.1 cytochrome c biogenesis ABC transporter permease [Calderihabitans maritimus]